MPKLLCKTISLITLITLVSACGPATTPVPSTATIVPTPTVPTTTRVLFIGNSLTVDNNLPGMFVDLAQSGSHAVETGLSAAGGGTWAGHTTSAITVDKIAQRMAVMPELIGAPPAAAEAAVSDA